MFVRNNNGQLAPTLSIDPPVQLTSELNASFNQDHGVQLLPELCAISSQDHGVQSALAIDASFRQEHCVRFDPELYANSSHDSFDQFTSALNDASFYDNRCVPVLDSSSSIRKSFVEKLSDSNSTTSSFNCVTSVDNDAEQLTFEQALALLDTSVSDDDGVEVDSRCDEPNSSPTILLSMSCDYSPMIFQNDCSPQTSRNMLLSMACNSSPITSRIDASPVTCVLLSMGCDSSPVTSETSVSVINNCDRPYIASHLCHSIPVSSPHNSPSVLPLTLKYDMGWQKCSSGRAYNSLSGIGSMIGHNTGEIVGYGSRCNFDSLQPLVERKVCGLAMLRKMAASGLSLNHLKLAYTRNGDSGLQSIFGEQDSNKKVRVTKSKKIAHVIGLFLAEQ